jgi:hypothetical protein
VRLPGDPLSLAALVGARYRHRGLAIGVAVVAQALIFGGAHANYPGFPAYSRLVELFVPSVLWALIFLRFGLVPTIVLHALFDLVLFSIPLFLVDAPGSGLQRGLVIAAGLVPLGVLLVRRASAGAWGELAAQLRNAAWRPLVPEAAHAAQPAERPPAAIAGWVAAFQRALPWLAVAGFVLWALATPWRPDVPALPQDRAAAIARADALLAANGVVLPPGWLRFAVPKSALDDPAQQQWHKFVWRGAGADAYRALVGGALAPPLWEVRYARFIGDVADRAEVAGHADRGRRGARDPPCAAEARPGAKLARDDAQALADKAVRERLQDEPAALTRIGAEEKQRPARIDWSFVYADPRVDVGKGGQARVLVNLAGDEIAGAGRFVHVPEEWQRAEREREGRLTLVKVLVAALSAIVALAALVFADLRGTPSECDRRAPVAVGAISLAADGAERGQSLPSIAMSPDRRADRSQAALASVPRWWAGCSLVAAGHRRRRAPRPQRGGTRPGELGGRRRGGAAVRRRSVPRRGAAPRSLPLWPRTRRGDVAAAARRGVDGLRVLTSPACRCSRWTVARLTADYSRRRFAVAPAARRGVRRRRLASGEDVVAATLGGLVDGLLAVVVVYAVLRFDYRTVTAYLAAAVVLGAATSAAQKGVASAWVGAAITAAVAIASAWLVARYIDAARRAASR